MPSHRSSLNSHHSTWGRRLYKLSQEIGLDETSRDMPLLISSIVRGVNCWTIRVQGAPVALYADGTFRSMSESYLTIIPCRPLGWPHAQLVHAPRPRPRPRPRQSVKHRFGGSPFSICLRTLRPGAVRRAAGTRPGSRYKLPRWAQYYSGRQVL